MDILKALHNAERKLLLAAGKIESDLSRIRAAINALGTKGPRPRQDGDPRRGKKLSAAHKRAIREGIKKAKQAKAAKLARMKSAA
jgi:hypothetical protein